MGKQVSNRKVYFFLLTVVTAGAVLVSGDVSSNASTGSYKSSTAPIIPAPYAPHTVVEANMVSDLYSVQIGLYSAEIFWRNVPPSTTFLSSNKGVWQIVSNSKIIESGKLKSNQDKIAGTIRTDGYYCIQVSNPKAKNSFAVRSDRVTVTKGVCSAKDIVVK